MDLESELNAWCKKVLKAKELVDSESKDSLLTLVDTYHMMWDVDQIIAKAFDQEPVMSEHIEEI